MTADTVSTREVTRESALRIANQTASQLVPLGLRYVSRDTSEPFLVLELTMGQRGSLVTLQAQVSRLVDARTFWRACCATWTTLIDKHRDALRRLYTQSTGPAEPPPVTYVQPDNSGTELLSEAFGAAFEVFADAVSSVSDTSGDTFTGGGGDFGGGGASGDF
jgi:uncharacterized membrane protein YgcG